MGYPQQNNSSSRRFDTKIKSLFGLKKKFNQHHPGKKWGTYRPQLLLFWHKNASRRLPSDDPHFSIISATWHCFKSPTKFWLIKSFRKPYKKRWWVANSWISQEKSHNQQKNCFSSLRKVMCLLQKDLRPLKVLSNVEFACGENFFLEREIWQEKRILSLLVLCWSILMLSAPPQPSSFTSPLIFFLQPQALAFWVLKQQQIHEKFATSNLPEAPFATICSLTKSGVGFR